MNPLARLDAYGTDDPGYGEGHPEDRCPLAFCERAVDEHPCTRHRIAAAINIIARRFVRSW